MRKSIVYLGFTIPLALIAGLLFMTGSHSGSAPNADRILAMKQLVRELRLTDLCLFTEARYTRNPSQADLHSAFQDHPLAFEHFPSGSMLLPPTYLWDFHDNLD
jgi:hypothetical protein